MGEATIHQAGGRVLCMSPKSSPDEEYEDLALRNTWHLNFVLRCIRATAQRAWPLVRGFFGDLRQRQCPLTIPLGVCTYLSKPARTARRFPLPWMALRTTHRAHQHAGHWRRMRRGPIPRPRPAIPPRGALRVVEFASARAFTCATVDWAPCLGLLAILDTAFGMFQ